MYLACSFILRFPIYAFNVVSFLAHSFLQLYLSYYFCNYPINVKFFSNFIIMERRERERERKYVWTFIAIDRNRSIWFLKLPRLRHEFPISPTTCKKVLGSICCIVHQALPPSSSLTPPPEGTVTTTGPNNHQVLLTFRVSLPIFEGKKGKRKPPSLL